MDAQTLKPAEWPTNRNQEWCPPGHGDLYAALAGSGTLDKLLADGVKVRRRGETRRGEARGPVRATLHT